MDFRDSKTRSSVSGTVDGLNLESEKLALNVRVFEPVNRRRTPQIPAG
jgi:hypothetical protein